MSWGIELRDGASNLVLSMSDRTLRQVGIYAVNVTLSEQFLSVPEVTTAGHYAVADNGAAVNIPQDGQVSYLGGDFTTGSTNIRVMAL